MLFHYKRLRNKHKVVAGNGRMIRFCLLIILICCAAMVCSVIMLQKIAKIESAHYLKDYYLTGTQKINEIWFNKILLLYEENEGEKSQDEINTLIEKIVFLIDDHFEKTRVATKNIYMFYHQKDSLQSFIAFYDDFLRGNFCEVIEKLEEESSHPDSDA